MSELALTTKGKEKGKGRAKGRERKGKERKGIKVSDPAIAGGSVATKREAAKAGGKKGQPTL